MTSSARASSDGDTVTPSAFAVLKLMINSNFGTCNGRSAGLSPLRMRSTGFNDSGLKTRPSELFRRNCWISFEPVEGSLKVLADYVGPNKIMWATDYPHSDGFFPGAPDMVRERLKGTSPATQRGVLAGGALGFYGMN
jgi:hypothetical protein